MDEEIKKEIEELKKEEAGISKGEKEESAEELVEELSKEEEDSQEQIDKVSKEKPETRKSKIFYLKILGIILAILGIVGGLIFLKFIFSKKQPIEEKRKTKVEVKVKKEKKIPSPLVIKKKIHSIAKKEPFAYKTDLSNFLIPLSEKEFLKVEITIFFPKYEDVKIFKQNILIYRNFFYSFLKKVPSSVWYDNSKLEEIANKAVKELKAQGIKPIPIKIRFDGAILKA